MAQSTSWPRHTIDAFSSGADGVRLADANGDGLLDIATGWEEGGFTKVYLHPGYHAAKSLWPSVVVGRTPSVEDAVFADLDGDGAMDVISCTEGKERKVYLHWGPQNKEDYLDSTKWVTEALPSSVDMMQWMFAVPMQVDGLHGMDLVVGGKGSDAAIGWFRSPPDARDLDEWVWYPISPATWIMSLILQDMDGDGDLDIVTTDRKPGESQGVRWLENPGAGPLQRSAWESHWIGGQGEEVMFMDISDVNGDGWEDVLTAAFQHQILSYQRLNGSGMSWRASSIQMPPHAGRSKAVKLGDINGDGTQDLVFTANTLAKPGKSGVLWSPSLAHGEISTKWLEISGPEGFKFDRIELIDMDGDGDLDVLTCEENFGTGSRGLGVIWYENQVNND